MQLHKIIAVITTGILLFTHPICVLGENPNGDIIIVDINNSTSEPVDSITDLGIRAGAEKVMNQKMVIRQDAYANEESEQNVNLNQNVEKDNEVEETSYSNRWDIELSDSEYQLLAYITMREAGNQSDSGQQAVVEVILNRVYSKEFPDTVEEVVSQQTNGMYQFSSYPSRTKFEPTEQVYMNIDLVLSGETNILPYKTLYFSRGGQSSLSVETIIGDHVFNNQPNYQS